MLPMNYQYRVGTNFPPAFVQYANLVRLVKNSYPASKRPATLALDPQMDGWIRQLAQKGQSEGRVALSSCVSQLLVLGGGGRVPAPTALYVCGTKLSLFFTVWAFLTNNT